MRLIDADALVKEIDNYADAMRKEYCNDFVLLNPNKVYSIALHMPIIDPVKHGHWTEDHECSICHNKAHSEIYNIRPEYDYDWEENLVETGGIQYDEDYEETEWCPHCGSRMDEEVKE